MNGLLIDENLPKSLSLPTGLKMAHATDFGSNPSDSELWKIARENEWVIVTKDADFSSRTLLENAPPKIVHVRLGNLRLKELIARLARLWPEIEMLLPEHKLVTVLSDRIEAIS